MFTICYWDDSDSTWVRHRRFRNLATAEQVAARDYGDQTIVVGPTGRIAAGNPTAQRCPRGLR